MMDTSVTSQIAALGRMTVSELQVEWRRLYGEPTRSRNRTFLYRRLAWRVQEIAHGGLSDHARERLDQLGSVEFTRARTPDGVNSDPACHAAKRAHRRHPGLPPVGSVITKKYKAEELRVTVRDDGFEHDGSMYGSLTALAKHITGCRSINGKLFFGLTRRSRS